MVRDEPVLVIAVDAPSASLVSSCDCAQAESVKIFVVSFMFHSSHGLPLCAMSAEVAKNMKKSIAVIRVMSLSLRFHSIELAKGRSAPECDLLPLVVAFRSSD
jgi:hypothetical protein